MTPTTDPRWLVVGSWIIPNWSQESYKGAMAEPLIASNMASLTTTSIGSGFGRSGLNWSHKSRSFHKLPCRVQEQLPKCLQNDSFHRSEHIQAKIASPEKCRKWHHTILCFIVIERAVSSFKAVRTLHWFKFHNAPRRCTHLNFYWHTPAQEFKYKYNLTAGIFCFRKLIPSKTRTWFTREALGANVDMSEKVRYVKLSEIQ